jgi:glycosyltransferase involved in cell wall biosynthesis
VWDEYVAGPLSEAFRSLAEQDSAAARIVLVDNASKVPLPQLPGVSIVRSARRVTLGAARNLGLEHVTTPYVVVWDADDVMLPGTLSFLEARIVSDPELAAYAAGILEDPSGERHRWPRRWIAALVRAPSLFALLNCIWSLYPTTGATIMRTELVRAAGGYSETESGEDWGLGVSLGFRGRIGWSERPGRIYRLHHRSVWARHMTARHLLSHARSVRERIRCDAGAPRWTRTALPLIQGAQYVAVSIHVAVERLRQVAGDVYAQTGVDTKSSPHASSDGSVAGKAGSRSLRQ